MPLTLTTTAGPVTLNEMWEGYAKGREFNGNRTLTMNYLLKDFQLCDAVLDAIMPTSRLSGGPGGFILRKPPIVCPEDSTLYALSAALTEGRGENGIIGNRPQFAFGIIAVNYGIPQDNVNLGNDPTGDHFFPGTGRDGGAALYSRDSVEPDNESVPAPEGRFIFQTAPQVYAENVSIKVGRRHYVRAISGIPYLPAAFLDQFEQTVNAATFFGVGRGRLLFKDYFTERETMTDGTYAQSVRLIFSKRTVEWNKEPRPDNGSWDFVVSSDGFMQYAYKDFTQIADLWTFQQ